MDSQVLAALLGALVGGLASGLAALGGSILVERMKLRKTVRIRMYEELLPPIRDTASTYMEAISEEERPQPHIRLFKGVEQLEHVSVMAGRGDHRLASRILARVYEVASQWRVPENYQETETGGRIWVGDSARLRALIEGINKDIADLEARLRKKVD